MNLKTFLPDYLSSSVDLDVNTEKNNIIFGANGIGKSSIYLKIKEDKKSEFHFLDYDTTKSDFKKRKKELIIASNLVKIDKLREEITEFINECKIKDNLKIFGISTKKSCPQNLQLVYTSGETENALKIDQQKINKISKIHSDLESDFMKICNEENFDKLKNIANKNCEIVKLNANLAERFLSSANDLVTSSSDKCPVCDSTVQNIKSILEEKIKNLALEGHSIAKELKIKSENYKKYECLINTNIFADISYNDITDYLVIGGSNENLSLINKNTGEIKSRKNTLDQLLKEKKVYYTNLKSMENTIKNSLNIFHEGIQFYFNDEHYQLEITLPRDIKNYSTGEINYILVCTKVYEFIASNHTTLIIDDILTSYDIVNQYQLIYLLAKVFSENREKKFICFTHNLNTIQLMYNQRKDLVNNYYLEKIEGELIMFDFDYNRFQKTINFTDQNESFTCQYILHLNIRDVQNQNDPLHKLYHYDGLYEDTSFNLSNDQLAKYTDDFSQFSPLSSYDHSDFINLFTEKIRLFISLRVWIEKIIYENIDNDKQIAISGKSLGVKIDKIFPRGSNNFIKGLSRDLLMSKKLMINDSSHIENRVNMPFEYIFNLKADDIKNEIINLKEIVIKNN